MKKTIILILFLFLSGCSFYTSNTFYEIDDTSSLSKVDVYDLQESGVIAGFGIGGYKPPVYAYKFQSDYYILYPIIIQKGFSAIGPPVLPIIPNPIYDKINVYKIRYYSLNSTAKNPPKSLTVIQGKNKITSCLLNKIKEDKAGIIYSCTMNSLPEAVTDFKLELLLNNGEKKIFNMRKKTYSEYSPLTSFNGPDSKPSITLE